MNIILIAGKARSGKTYAAQVLKEELEHQGKKVVITEYSKYIKLFAKELLSWDGKEPKPRKFLQDFGFFIRHEFEDQNYFIKRMKEDLKIYEHFVDVVIISDVRLKEEIEQIKEYPSISIHVINETNPSDLTNEEKNHETEQALDTYKYFNYSIENKTKEEMKEEIKNILKKEGYL